MGTLGRSTRNGKKPAPPRPERSERSHPAIAKLAAALKEHRETLEQQAATAEILRAISKSPGDAQPVFDAIIEKAHRLCGGAYTVLYRYDGKLLHFVAARGVNEKAVGLLRGRYPQAADRDKMVGRAVLEAKTFHTPDISKDSRFPAASAIVRRRAVVAVPLVRDDKVLGAISCGRIEARDFTKKDISLLKTFADQAVVAMENARLFNETKEALERQTGTAEILKVISSSPTDVQPVFDAIAKSAMRLLGGFSAAVTRRVGEMLHLVAFTTTSESGDKTLKSRFPVPLSHGHRQHVKAVLAKAPVYLSDTEAPEVSSTARELARARGYRSSLTVPMIRKGEAIGTIAVSRRQPGTFSNHQIDLLKTFANQAVIAIENVRLFNETKESLEQQTASSEILGVISSSPTDLAPVFDAILKSATQLCEAHLGMLNLYDGEHYRTVAQRGASGEFAKYVFERGAYKPVGGPLQAATEERRPVHIPDLKLAPSYLAGQPHAVKFVEMAGARTTLAVPLVKEGKVIGVILIYRPEVRPFTDKQIALVSMFANQAVIAIENARLFNETKEALEHQKASGDILRIVARSVENTDPVFEAITTAGMRVIPGARVALLLARDGQIDYASHSGIATERRAALAKLFPVRLDAESASGAAILEGRVVHIPDVAVGEGYRLTRTVFSKASGFRAMLAVPLLREGKAIGALNVSRETPGPFTDQQIALATTFADQAVIAIENARLFNETKNALARQTATADILRVLGSSVTDVQPVFDAIVKNCHELFKGSGVVLRLASNGELVVKASVGYAADPVPIERSSAMGICVVDGRTVHFPNLDDAAKEFPRIRQLGLKYGYRSGIYAPLMRAGQAIGAIGVMRRELGGFDDKEVQLLNTFADQAVIAIENVRLFNETKEALEQQTATSAILKVIRGSPTDIQPVLDSLAENAARLCDAADAIIQLREGELLRFAAHYGTIPNLPQGGTRAISRDMVTGRAVLEGRQIHVTDLQAESEEFPVGSAIAKEFGYRTILVTPLMRDGAAIGTIMIRRTEVRPFGDKHLALVKTFADQAVIAIENVRLFNETKDALERQTATSHILQIISSAHANTQPVFDAIVQSAQRLMSAKSAALILRRESEFFVAAYSAPGLERTPAEVRTVPLDPGKNFPSRVILRGEVLHIPDWEGEDIPEHEKLVAKAFGFGSGVQVPLLREGQGIGALVVARETKGPFHEKEIALLRSFADQAVIAIENARLINETKEALEQQTGTAEILKVISSSPTDAQPVFDIIADRAVKLCDAEISVVARFDGELIHLVASHGVNPRATQIMHQVFPMRPGDETVMARTVRSRSVVHVADVLADPLYAAKDVAAAAQYRSSLGVPMTRGGEVIGGIFVARAKAGFFTDKQVALLQTFADQAVIAIENVRLFNDTKEALDKQTATAEILSVISSSPTDTQPVFDAIVANATRLCQAAYANVFRYDGELIHWQASHGWPDELLTDVKNNFPMRPDRSRVAGRVVLTGEAAHVSDTRADPEYDRALAEELRYRKILGVPLLREGKVLGALSVGWEQPGAVEQRHEDLLRTFAAQAVIAIENVRLFNETKEALEQQTAISEVLRVISDSPTDVKPVLDAVALRAARICDASDARIFLVEGEKLRHRSGFGDVPFSISPGELVPLSRDTVIGRAVIDRAPVHLDDFAALPPQEFPLSRKWQERSGWRTCLCVPLMREGRALGVISLRRLQVRPFTEKQVTLVKTFADQAAIAIENVRLFNETKEALEHQKASAEILAVISSSPTDVQPVFDAIASSAVRLFDVRTSLMLVRGERLEIGAMAGFDEKAVRELHRVFPRPIDRETTTGRTVLDRAIQHIPDVDAPEIPEILRQTSQATGVRALLSAPILREGVAIGAIVLTRATPGPFSDKQIALLQTFASQAVIAIENVRLFKELQARTEALTKSVDQLTALGEVGQAISSTLDLETVLKTIVSRAVQLTGLDAGAVYEYEEHREEFHLRAAENMSEEVIEVLRATPIRKGEGAVGGTALTREPIQVPETQDESYKSRLRELVIRAGRRALLAVPLRHEERIVGALLVQRNTPGAFAPEVVELLKTFAAQSALAIQNARLFREIAEKGKQLEVASRHKSDFLASMSHELRTPLNALLGFNEMILGDIYGEVPADMKPPLAQMQSSGKHLLRLINNVLDLAKIEAGRMELALSDYAVHDIVESVRSTLHPLAADKGLEFLTSVRQDIPLAYGDPGRITQCLMNLAGNSLKFTKAGKVEISVALNDGRLRYCVADTGIGIPREKIPTLFTEFKQTDATIASEYGGTGLGLSISKKFIEMHGGRIWVESEPGKGSAFTFEVPLRANAT